MGMSPVKCLTLWSSFLNRFQTMDEMQDALAKRGFYVNFIIRCPAIHALTMNAQPSPRQEEVEREEPANQKQESNRDDVSTPAAEEPTEESCKGVPEEVCREDS